MSCEIFAKTNFRIKTLATIEQANAILEEYTAQGFTLTLRQLFYQFVARGLIANTTAEYKRLSRTITDARRAGLSIGIILKTRRATSRPIRHGRARPISCAAPRKATSGIFGRTNGAAPKSGSKKPPLSASSSRPAAAGASLTWRRGDTPSHSELYAAGKRLNRITRGHQKPVISATMTQRPRYGPEPADTLYARRPIEVDFRTGPAAEPGQGDRHPFRTVCRGDRRDRQLGTRRAGARTASTRCLKRRSAALSTSRNGRPRSARNAGRGFQWRRGRWRHNMKTVPDKGRGSLKRHQKGKTPRRQSGGTQ